MHGGTLAAANSPVFVEIVMGHAKMSHLRDAAGVTHFAVNSGGMRSFRVCRVAYTPRMSTADILR